MSMPMSMQEVLDAKRPAKILGQHTPEERELFGNVLTLLKNHSKQATLIFELVETMVVEKLKKDVAPQGISQGQYEDRGELILWGFIPNVDDYGSANGLLRRKNKAKYKALKEHYNAIKEILENAGMW